MANWGMGVTQSDTYCEVYDAFMDEYDNGKPIAAIKQDIIDEYLMAFDEADGILHDVYFAIGKAEWMCGGVSDEIMTQITRIIKNGDNIAFYRTLEATEAELKQRQKHLTKYLKTLSIPRGKVKPRRIPEERYVEKPVNKLPSFRCGDVFAYAVGDCYRLLGFISRDKFWSVAASYCYIWTERYAQLPAVEDLLHERVLPLGYFTVDTFPPMDKLQLLGNLPALKLLDFTNPNVLCKEWQPATRALATEANITEDFPAELCIPLSDCLEKIQALRGHDNQ